MLNFKSNSFILHFETQSVRISQNGKTPETVAIAPQDIDATLNLLKRINVTNDTSGSRLATIVEVDDFQPWWFIQENLMWKVLDPLLQYKLVLETIPEDSTVCTINAPKNFLSLLSLLKVPYKEINRTVFQKIKNILGTLRTAFLTFGLAAVSIVSLFLFLLKRPSCLLYIIDSIEPKATSDFRLSGIYHQLRQKNISIAEVVHCHSITQAWKTLWNIKRPIIFMEPLIGTLKWIQSLLPTKQKLNFASISTKEVFVNRHNNKLISGILGLVEESGKTYKIYKTLIRYLKPKFTLSLDDSRHANELLAASRENNLPTIMYQHGLTFNEYFVGHGCYGFSGGKSHAPDLFGLWSNYFRAKLLNFSAIYNSSNTKVTGPIRELVSPLAYSSPRSKMQTILIISEPKLQKGEIVAYLEKLARNENFRLILKLRPGETKAPLYNSFNIECITDTAEAIKEADVVIGSYSSLLYEAIYHQVPVVLIKSSSKYFAKDLAFNNLATLVESPEMIFEGLTMAVSTSEDELLNRKLIVWGEESNCDCSLLFENILTLVQHNRSNSETVQFETL